MSIFSRKKANNPDGEGEIESLGPLTVNPAEDEGDRDDPSVNSTKKNSKVIGVVGIVFVALLGGYIILQLNSGDDRKARAARKKEKEVAETNAVSGTMPVIGKPPIPLELASAPAATASAPSAQSGAAADQVPAMAGAQPIGVQASKPAVGNAANVRPVGPNGKPVQTPYEAALERKARGGLEVKFAGGDAALRDPATGLPPQAQSEVARRMAALGFDPQGKPLNSSGGATVSTGAGGGSDPLSNSLVPSVTKATKAGILPNRDFLLTKGTFLDCALETRIDSTVPGMTSCVLTSPIFSDKGILLLEAGSKVTGQYQGGLKQGQARIFVLWTRITTPKGVAINIDSPGTDPLGASGHDGYVDTHFWERFGGAIMLSLIGDVGEYIANTAQRGQTNQTQFRFDNTQEASENMATEALKNSINIPPTLRKNHGDHINIYLARDLTFEDVYALRAK